ncbi:MAG: DUF433 domain-containing protein [Pyrinomonadaceae bacterium MAG19_C2-C3]|nr:DUF433 domain-containing protein [Pyrinomonadaceae bacterium MAG19_C2-C3]
MTIHETQNVPLFAADDGTIRVQGTRVSFDSIIHHFNLGATAEQIAHKFPAVPLTDIYACITYYLNHREEVEDYLRQQESEADASQQLLETDPQHRRSSVEMRERLLARWAVRHQAA